MNAPRPPPTHEREAGSLEFALARMQSRLSRRPSGPAWAAIEEARGLVPVIEAARGTTLEPLVARLPLSPDLHAVDRATRTAWSALVSEAAGWMPAEWQAALAWCDGSGTAGEVHPTLLPSLALPGWRRRWPAGYANDPALMGLVRLFAAHLARFRDAAHHEAPALRAAFAARLAFLFRRHPLEPAGAFAWLALAALDLERLRGELARRVAFPEARIAA